MDANHTTPGTADPALRPRRRMRALTIPEQIVNRVAAAILSGEYRDGERLREQELAEAYGVSRGPVREALRKAVEWYLLNGYVKEKLHKRILRFQTGLRPVPVAQA